MSPGGELSALGAFLFLFKNSYMRPLYTTPLGLAMMTAAVVLVGLGTVWMRNVVKVEV